MCGIVGVFRPNGDARTDPWSDGRLERMVEFIRPRGPDQEGRWRSSSGLCQLAHTRLSILDLSDASRQPFQSASGLSHVVFNGEIYNFQALSERLRSGGWQPRTSSDTEVLVEYVERFGLDAFLSNADGMFAFAFYDERRQELLIARDRFGEKPLFWAVLDGSFVFGSDLRSLAVYAGGRCTLNSGAIREYFHWGYVPGTETIYLGMNKLRPGCMAVVSRADGGLRVREETYFDPRREAALIAQSGASSPSDEELRSTMVRIASSRTMGDVPVGAMLSGGIDSSLVVALLRATGQEVKTFSIGFHNEGYNEAHWAKSVAEELGTEHHELYLSEADALRCAPALAGMLAEPIADSSLLPTFLVSRFAREHVTVALSGDGGDEMFGGYSRYASLGSLSRGMDVVPRPLRRVLERGMSFAGAPEHDAAMRAITERLPAKWQVARPRHKLLKLARLIGSEGVSDAYEALVMSGASAFAPPSRLRTGATFTEDWLSSARLHDLERYLPDDICTKVDRASMAVALEVRAPMLSREVFELSWRYRSSELMAGSRGKLPLRRVLGRYIPTSLFERPKMGFGIPVHEWTRGALRPAVESAIEGLSSRGVFRDAGIDESELRRVATEHNQGLAEWGTELWAIMILGSWLDGGAKAA